MKKFSERFNADWYTEDRLADLLQQFFEDESEPRTLTHLYFWLNTDWITFEKRKLVSDRFNRLLMAAELACEQWVVNNGFANDKSFAKFTLQTQHNRTIKTEVKNDVTFDKCYLPLKNENN
jgi:hypothetical protein